jgi:energy-coupling factor transporter ATP-binding protein EcfA2
LSEGEFRIVSLAAFLADVEARQDKGPYVFDDPISSLDQVFEEAAVSKLVELAKTRQVIVFTHRLSLMAQLEEVAKKEGRDIRILALRSEQWGTGEPGETPIHAKKPEGALNALLQRIPKARAAAQRSNDEYEILAKGICSDFRIIMERLIENDLLADVVQRFRRGVQTKDKIKKLAKINADDCTLFDNLMTKYSKYEHSQPQEAPVPLPRPDELEEDFRRVKNWLEEFKDRTIP